MTLTLVLTEDQGLLNVLRVLKRVELYTLQDMVSLLPQRPELETPDLVIVKGSSPADTVDSVASIASELPNSNLVVVDTLTPELKNRLWKMGSYGIVDPNSGLTTFQQLIDYFHKPAPAPVQPPTRFPEKQDGYVDPQLSSVSLPTLPPVATPVSPPTGATATLAKAGVQVESLDTEQVRRVLMSGTSAVSLDPVDKTRVISIVSPKGGVGKTSIATNLAFILGAKHPNKVVLVDLDLQSPAVSTQLNIYPQATIEHAVSPEAQRDTLILKTLLVKHEKGFYVLPGAISPASRDLITGDQIRTLIQQLKTEFEYVLLDTAGGISDITLSVLDECNAVMLVSTLDLASVKSLKREIEVIKQIGLLPTHRIFVVNQAQRNSGLRVKDIEDLMGFPVNVLIQREPDVLTSINRGEPMSSGKKKNGFTKGILSIASLIEKVAPEGGSPRHRRLEV